jgi:hypothetical protein
MFVVFVHDSIDIYSTDPKKLIKSARSMSPALKFHDDGDQPHMIQMVCSISFSVLTATINASFILLDDIAIGLNLFNLSVSLFSLFF